MGRLNAGQLSQRVTLLTPGAKAGDGRGGFTPGTDTEKEVWARVRTLRGGEKLALGQVLNTDAVEVTVRNGPLLSPAQRLRWKAATYNVLSVTPDEYNEYTLLTCVSDGR